MNKDKFANYVIILIILIMVFTLLRNCYVKNLLTRGTKQTVGIITKINKGTGVRQVKYADYYYTVDKKKISGNSNGNFNFMNIGDTVLIEYSIKDNSISQVVDKYYMKKYQNLKR